jgi:oligopeptide transport system ATP-binding protein
LNNTNDIILSVKDLKTYFKTDEGVVKAVNGVSFDLRARETMGLVGESACGKSVTNLSIMKLIPSPPGKIAEGEVLFEGQDILKMSEHEVRHLRGNKISMIFQDPMTSLNPFLRISTQLSETIRLHQKLNKSDAHEKSIQMLKIVGIPSPEKRVDDYPHQFSGGMRQRVMIAMALSCNPKILIADEPTTALDVTIQAQILDLMRDLKEKFNSAIILITHNLGVVAGICDNVCVMYAGRIVEKGTSTEIFHDPRHPYTKALLKSLPRHDQEKKERLYSIEGQPPNLIDLPTCCPFHPRCAQKKSICTQQCPETTKFDNNREVSCWLL